MPNPYENRNRVNYGNEFLYTAFDATGYHFNDETKEDPDCSLRNIPWTDCSGNLIRQLHRIQSINYGFGLTFKDVNEFGKLARKHRVAIEAPDVTIDFEYYLADGYNEQVMGFVVDGETQATYKHLIANNKGGMNFFVGVAPEGREVIGANLEYEEERRRVIGIGNSFLSQYAVTAELGSIPRARVSFDAFNLRSYHGACNLPVPSLDIKNDFCQPDLKFSLPDTYESFVYEKLQGLEDIVYEDGAGGLQTGDIKIDLDDGAFFSKQVSGLNNYNDGGAHIQGFTINMSLSTTKLQRLGRSFSFARAHEFPSLIQVQVQAIVSELKETFLWGEICKNKKHNLVLRIDDCRSLSECDGNLVPHTANMIYYLRGAILDNESFDSSVSDNKIVNLNFSVPVGGADDKDDGMFIFGKSHFPDRPALLAWGKPL